MNTQRCITIIGMCYGSLLIGGDQQKTFAEVAAGNQKPTLQVISQELESLKAAITKSVATRTRLKDALQKKEAELEAQRARETVLLSQEHQLRLDEAEKQLKQSKEAAARGEELIARLRQQALKDDSAPVVATLLVASPQKTEQPIVQPAPASVSESSAQLKNDVLAPSAAAQPAPASTGRWYFLGF